MRKYILILAVLLSSLSLMANDVAISDQALDDFALHAGQFKQETSSDQSISGQDKELLDLLMVRERLANLNIDWFNQPHQSATLNKNINTFIELKKEMDHLAEFAWRYGMLMRQKVEKGEVITGHNRFIVLKIADAFSVVTRKLSEANSLYTPNRNDIKSNNLLSDNDSIQARENALWLSAHLTIFHGFIQAYNGFFREKHTRNMIKDLERAKEGKDAGLDELAIIAKHTLSGKSRDQLQDAIKSYVASRASALKSSHDDSLRELVASIESNPSSQDLYNDIDFNISYHSFGDSIARFFSGIVGSVSKIFGNFAGRFRFRRGYLYNFKEYRVALLEHLKPLDILTEKTPFALTDTFIPGHYGHAAIYLGTEKQLKEIGLWDSEVIKPHQKEIREGKVILEALRPGVWMNTLEEFLNIDEIGVWRQPNVLGNLDEAQRIYERGFAQLGKDYDFNFDVSTLDKIVCSELVYHAFGRINWPVKYILGRPTISPDNIAEVAYYDNAPIGFLLGNRAERRDDAAPIDKLDIAQKLGLIQLDNGHFGKQTRQCRDVHHENGELERVCYGKIQALIYKAPNESIYDLPGTAQAL